MQVFKYYIYHYNPITEVCEYKTPTGWSNNFIEAELCSDPTIVQRRLVSIFPGLTVGTLQIEDFK